MIQEGMQEGMQFFCFFWARLTGLVETLWIDLKRAIYIRRRKNRTELKQFCQKNGLKFLLSDVQVRSTATVSHHGEDCPVLGFLSCEFHVLV